MDEITEQGLPLMNERKGNGNEKAEVVAFYYLKSTFTDRLGLTALNYLEKMEKF